jgi:catechol 2,3-dioxygenase
MSITQGAYAELGVDDLEAAVGFHTDVLGLTELGRESGSVSLGCGVDGRTDLILSNGGGTGVRLVALEVSSEEDLERYAARLAEHGVERDRRSDPRTGVAKALHFAAPSGLQLEPVVSADGPAYLNPGAAGRRSGIAPVDYDHITLKVPDPVAMVAFLRDVLDFAVSDEMHPAPDTLVAAWTRAGQLHHDIAMFKGAPGETLHHFALRLESFDHLKHAADHLAAAGVAIETGPGRHRVGGNVYLFFWAPGGNRYEFSAEMPRVGSRMAVRLVDRAPVVPLVLLRAAAGGSARCLPRADRRLARPRGPGRAGRRWLSAVRPLAVR